MANKIVEDAFRAVEESVAKLRRMIDQHDSLQKDLVKAEPPKEKAKAEEPKK